MSQPNSSSNPAHPSLPPRPPVSLPARPSVPTISRPALGNAGINIGGNAGRTGGFGSFGSTPMTVPTMNTAFKPRSVASQPGWKQPHNMSSIGPRPIVIPQSALSGYNNMSPAPVPSPYHQHASNSTYYNRPQQQPHQQQQQQLPQHIQHQHQQVPSFQNGVPNPNQPPYQQQQGYPQQYGQTQPQTHAPIATDYDAQVAQWQSAYYGGTGVDATQSQYHSVAPTSTTAGTDVSGIVAPPAQNQKPEEEMYVVRSGGGKTWMDPLLLEWDSTHFRLFVGNLAGDVSDDALHKAFVKYPSLSKARVVRAKGSNKSRGYGFVSFSDSDDYFRAFKEMQGKYIGNHPVKIDKANSNITPVVKKPNGNHGHHKGKGGNKGKFRAQQAQQQQDQMEGSSSIPAHVPPVLQQQHVQQSYEYQPSQGNGPSPTVGPGGAFRTMAANVQTKRSNQSDGLGPKKNSGVSKKKQDKGKTRGGLKILG